MKKHWLYGILCAILLIVLALLILFQGPRVLMKYTFDENMTWSLDDDGTLTVSGTGKMPDYTAADQTPWYPFYNEIRHVKIDEGVTYIGNYAFEGCSTMSALTLPTSLSRIGHRAFSRCISLNQVEFPINIAAIDYRAFENCEKLVSVRIPESVRRIGTKAFAHCDSLTGIWVDPTNPNYSSDKYGVLFNKNKTILIQAPGQLEGTYAIPDSVITLQNDAFYSCHVLRYVTVPDSILAISEDAFRSCIELRSVTLPDSILTIGPGAFYGCGNLTSIRLPSSVRSVASDAFSKCSLLEAIWVDPDNKHFSNDSRGVLYDARRSRLILAPSAITGAYQVADGVTEICTGAFDDRDGLTSIHFPDSLCNIGPQAFQDCDGLTEIILPDNVTGVGDQAFFSCDALQNVTLSNTLNTISDKLFSQCSGITNIKIPDKVMIIGSEAFSGTGLTQVTVPNSVSYIEDGAFNGCISLSSVTIGNGLWWFGNKVFSGCDSLATIAFCGSAPSMDPTALDDVHATVLYDTNDPTWENVINSSTGTDVTWADLGKATALELVSGPDPESFTIADTIDPSAFQIVVRYDNGFQRIVSPQELTLEPCDMTTAGTKVLRLHYQDLTLEVEIQVQELQHLQSVDASLFAHLTGSHNGSTASTEQTQTFTQEGATKLAVTFDPNTWLDPDQGQLIVYDGNDVPIAAFTGTEASGATIVVSGDTVKIVLRVEGYSWARYAVSSIETVS